MSRENQFAFGQRVSADKYCYVALRGTMIGLKKTLETKNIDYEPLGQKERYAIQREWLTRFAQEVKDVKGKWVFNGFMWHGFSFGMQECAEGKGAMAAYRHQNVERFYLFDENAEHCYRCRGRIFPDLSGAAGDVYVFPESMGWTMVFTHEIDHGPFFAECRT